MISPQGRPHCPITTLEQRFGILATLHLDLRLQLRGHLRQYFPMGMVVELAYLLFPASSLRLARNAYAGKISRSSLLLRLQLHSTEISLNSLTSTNRAFLDSRGLVRTVEIQDCNFRLISTYLNYIRERSLPRQDINIAQHSNKASQAKRLAPRSFSIYTIGRSPSAPPKVSTPIGPKLSQFLKLSFDFWVRLLFRFGLC